MEGGVGDFPVHLAGLYGQARRRGSFGSSDAVVGFTSPMISARRQHGSVFGYVVWSGVPAAEGWGISG